MTDCPTPAKVSYVNRLRALKADGLANSGMRPYHCKCGFWHNGHPFKTRTKIRNALTAGNVKSWAANRRRTR